MNPIQYKKKRKKQISSMLSTYSKKRKFSQTTEPKPKIKKYFKKLIYVIQEHHARNLHYDLRLEMNGVLKSWAVPKQPPRTKSIKRLAIKVEDHPLGYENFKGTIPKGNYGAGTVKIWDKGTYKLIKKNPKEILFELYGKKLKGKYALIKAKLKTGKAWLFFKV